MNTSSKSADSDTDVLSTSFIERINPRPLPRFPPVPIPFNMEKPTFTVPDVSLIFNSPAPSSNSTANRSAGTNGSLTFSTLQSPPSTQSARFVSPPPVPTIQPRLSPPTSAAAPTNQPTSSPEPTITIKLIKHLLDMARAQGKLIKKMEVEIQALKQNEEKHFIELMSAIKDGMVVDRQGKTEMGTPTETALPSSTLEVRTSETAAIGAAALVSANKGLEERQHGSKSNSRSNSSSDSSKLGDQGRKSSRKSKSTSPANKVDLNGSRNQVQNEHEAAWNVNNNEPSGSSNFSEFVPEDLSAVFRDLQLPSIREQSVCSSPENSLGQINLQDYHNESLNISQYETSSSSDEEQGDSPTVQPTATFYRNVLGCVNRILENDPSKNTDQPVNNNNEAKPHPYHPYHQYAQRSSPHHASPQQAHNINLNSPGTFTRSITDTTLYGFPSNNLSFATKQYLQRHGLVNSGSPRLNKRTNNYRDHGHQQQQQHHHRRPFFPDFGSSDSSEERVLDVTALKNQPKLL